MSKLPTTSPDSPAKGPSQVAKECAEALRPYRIRNVVGDNYGGEWPKEQFRKHNISYELSEKHRSQPYLDLIRPLTASGLNCRTIES